MAEDTGATRTASLKMVVGGRPIAARLEVPAGPTTPRHLLPALQQLTDVAVEAASEDARERGKSVSCQAGCGACCRQLMPLAHAEAFELSALVERLPEPRRSEVRRRFRQAEERLAAAEILESLDEPAPTVNRLHYFQLGIACPFLEDESCSIYADRPLACREYLVTSPARNCQQPSTEAIDRLRPPALASKALLEVERGVEQGPLSWVPLVLALRWSQAHCEPTPSRSGPELMNDLLRVFSGRELPTAPELRRASPGEATVEPSNHSGIGPAVPEQRSTPKGRSAAPTMISQAEAQAHAYDEVPYYSKPYAFSHPSTLAAIAILHGMRPPSVERCRVLELGCASGGNLIPMAWGLPESRFSGVDLSPRQVSDGCRQINRLGLKNVDLRVMDLMEVDGSLGEFDYIICHGVFSWVPRPVQEKILGICSQNLAPQGVALVSYNTYPFWRLHGMVREMLLYHTEAVSPPRERVRQGREFLNFLAESCALPQSVYAWALREELISWRRHADDYLRHDHMGEVNEPFYFHEFAARLTDHALQYLGDARVWDRAATLSATVRQQLSAYSDDVVRYEQYLDFLCDGGFRRSLICHAAIPLDRQPRAESLERLWISADARPVPGEPSAEMDCSAQFRSPEGVEFSAPHPWLRAALTVLAERWPLQLTFDEICGEARRALGDRPEAKLDPCVNADLLKLPLLECGLKQVVELHAHRWPASAAISDRPRVTALARLQAEVSCAVSSPRLEVIELRELERQLLLRLDGHHSRDELIQSISELIASGKFTLTAPNNEDVVADVPDVRSLIDEALARFARLGLLDGDRRQASGA